MKNNINLVIKTNELEDKSINRYKSLRLTAIILLSAVGAFSIILIILIVTSPLSSLRKERDSALQSLDRLHPKIAKIIVTNERLGSVASLMKTRLSLQDRIDWLLTNIPSDATMKDYKIERNAISVTLEVNTLATVDTVVNTIRSLSDNGGKVTSATLSAVTYNSATGTYSFSLDISLL